MNGIERMLAVLNGKQADRIPVTPHWWGVYKFQLAGDGNGWRLQGQALADVDSFFYHRYRPDMVHLSAGPWKLQWDHNENEKLSNRRIWHD